MEHEHSHNHLQSVTLTKVNRAFIIGISLNLLFVIVEVIVGLFVNSLSLLSDAGHNLADVGALALSLLAFRLLKVKSKEQFTYGYRKVSILVALLNSIVLLISIGAIVYEAILRLSHPEPLPGITIAIVAGFGIVVNSLSALMFLRDKDKDINIRSAYLHLMNDAAVSLGIVIGGFIIFFTNWFWIDSLLSIIISGVILFSTWQLLRDSLRLSLDGVPEGIRIDDIKANALKVNGVKDLHHIHVWAISTNENALTAHLVLSQGTTNEQEQKIKHELKHELEHQGIQHITLETERENESCETEEC
jgi:cobalt-zinc-cadmium efflux system protein